MQICRSDAPMVELKNSSPRYDFDRQDVFLKEVPLVAEKEFHRTGTGRLSVPSLTRDTGSYRE
jgi:hypothetical protein